MRSCPCCKSLAFEDLDRCYECMMPFAHGAHSVHGVHSAHGAHGTHGTHGASSSKVSDFGEICGCSIDMSVTGEKVEEVARGDAWDIHVEPQGFPPFDKRIDSKKPRLSIGRALDSDVIIADLHASRRHADLVLEGEGLFVYDRHSRNMTYLDGVPVVGSHKVEPGSELRVASARIVANPV